jgi:serine/threonine-protein kinase
LADLDPEERSREVEAACGDDEQLRRLVVSLFDADAGQDVAKPRVETSNGPAPSPGLPSEVGAQALAGGSFEPGSTVAHYRIVRRLARGGMGEVYVAEDTRLQRQVALKFLTRQWRGDPAAEERFLHEARAASALDDPRICTVYEIGETESGQLFISMAYSDGETLRDTMSRGPLPVTRALEITLEVLAGLAKAHEQGIVHRDVKPSNVFLASGEHVRLLDFGIARLVRQVHLTPTGHVAGTPAYMSPEQIRGEEADPRMDLWGVAVLLYEMVSGRLPFGGESHHTLMHAILHEPPQALPVLDSVEQQRQLGAVLEKSLAKDPADRYQSAGEMAADVERVLSSNARAQTPPVKRSGRRASDRLRRRLAAAVLPVLVAAGIVWWVTQRSPADSAPLEPVESLVVLPLENLTGDQQEQYFVDGVTTSLITHLSKLRVFDVISRTSAMQYQGSDRPVRQIAEELGVDAVVEGAVLRGGHRIRISAQVIDGRTDRSLWADEYERDLEDTLRLQREVAADIARAIREELSPPVNSALERSRKVDRNVLEAYLRGRALWSRRTESDLRRAIEYFEDARRLDPSFAEAYAGLADAHFMLGFYGYDSGSSAYARSMVNARKALAIDPSLAEAHATLGAARALAQYDWEGAEADLRRAIALNPSYESGHSFFAGFVLAPTRRLEDAVEEIREAQRLDPLSPVIVAASAHIHWWAGLDEEAMAETARALDLSPRFWLAHAIRGALELEAGRTASAFEAYRAAAELTRRSPLSLGMLGYAHGVAGDPERAREILAELEELATSRYVSPYDLALVHLGLNDRETALVLLEAAVDERAAWVIHIPVDRRFAPLYDEPRFQALVAAMNLG